MSDINKLILGDNLEILKTLESETVDLIYLDPPFFSNRNYEVIWGDSGEVRSFEDRFSGGIDHYISWLKERVIEMHRILKPTGSIFLHCDYHANSYIRVYILDKIFGDKNFRGEIAWQRHNAHNDAKQKLAVLKDTIWYYSKNGRYKYNPVYIELTDDYKEVFYRNEDEKGVYRLSDLTGAGLNKNDKKWKTYHPKDRNRHWAIPVKPIANLAGENAKNLTTIEKLDLLYKNDLIAISSNGVPSYKRYLDDSKGSLLGDVWTDIKAVSSQSKEKIGYPTQKPLKLLERIIAMSSNEGDVVLDPFIGGGTTVAVADKLNRKWIGIDQSVAAIKVTEARMTNQQDLFASPFVTQLHKYDYDTLRYKDAFRFEIFIVTQFGGINNTKQRGDLGLDGKTRENQPIQVKRSDAIGRNVVDNFKAACERNDKNLYEKNKLEKQAVGYIIAFSFGKGAVQEVARLKNEENVIIKLVTVEEIIPIAKKPKLTIEIIDKSVSTTTLSEGKGGREIEFIAKAQSEAGIEFFMWDFDYKNDKFNLEILFDKTGKQIWKFKAGLHQIAVKVIDNEGLESIEIVKLKVNGKIERS
jgi:DNA modification methylase